MGQSAFFCICENEDANQLCSNREADQRSCFRNIDSTETALGLQERVRAVKTVMLRKS